MCKDNISVEVAISIVNWDKKSSWNKLLKDYFEDEEIKTEDNIQ